jgi:hypothetical protein
MKYSVLTVLYTPLFLYTLRGGLPHIACYAFVIWHV